MARHQLYCSFCGKRQDEVFYLVSGPSVFICDECTSAAYEIIMDKKIEAGVKVITRIAEHSPS